MTNRADEYLKQAKDCERLAEETTDPIAKDGFEILARDWRQLVKPADTSATVHPSLPFPTRNYRQPIK